MKLTDDGHMGASPDAATAWVSTTSTSPVLTSDSITRSAAAGPSVKQRIAGRFTNEATYTMAAPVVSVRAVRPL
jgi:hypothetical protein